MRHLVFALAGAALFSTAAAAQTQEQRYGFDAIQRADLTAAEARLNAALIEQPNEPSVLLNLAHVYWKTGRTEQAEALYRKVLAGENVMMLTAGRSTVGSHQLAQKGLDRARQMASR
jgi:Tfp pilus assembly protein PilF